MQIDHHKEEMILDDDEDKDYDIIEKEEVDCAGLQISRREKRPL